MLFGVVDPARLVQGSAVCASVHTRTLCRDYQHHPLPYFFGSH